jgi:uncharacterized protein with NAD-binding domain and iron-sulfur cluster
MDVQEREKPREEAIPVVEDSVCEMRAIESKEYE